MLFRFYQIIKLLESLLNLFRQRWFFALKYFVDVRLCDFVTQTGDYFLKLLAKLQFFGHKLWGSTATNFRILDKFPQSFWTNVLCVSQTTHNWNRFSPSQRYRRFTKAFDVKDRYSTALHYHHLGMDPNRSTILLKCCW